MKVKVEKVGEFSDDRVYSAQRIGEILGTSYAWVVQHIIRPASPGEGVKHCTLGRRTLVSGRDIRMWIESGPSPVE